jgi:hypothetical protein
MMLRNMTCNSDNVHREGIEIIMNDGVFCLDVKEVSTRNLKV